MSKISQANIRDVYNALQVSSANVYIEPVRGEDKKSFLFYKDDVDFCAEVRRTSKSPYKWEMTEDDFTKAKNFLTKLKS